jgi:hypothetical protein
MNRNQKPHTTINAIDVKACIRFTRLLASIVFCANLRRTPILSLWTVFECEPNAWIVLEINLAIKPLLRLIVEQKHTNEGKHATKPRKSFFLGFLCGGLFIMAFVQLSVSPVPRDVSLVADSPTPMLANTPHEAKRRKWNHTAVRDHPHAGARDEYGTWNYVPDVEAIRRYVLERIQSDPDSTNPQHYLPLEPNSTGCHDAPGKGFE